jgi:polyphenol oxidase
MSQSERPRPITDPLLGTGPIVHGFFTRHGGVSQGIYCGLNVGVGSSDDPLDIRENRHRAADFLGGDADTLITPWQVHSADAISVEAPFSGQRPKADGIVTATPGLIIGVVTADCGPILFADPQAQVIGAAHAGWKGALNGVLENTIAAMESLGARRQSINAVLGPSISQNNYEVGPEFVSTFVSRDPGFKTFFQPSTKQAHAMFDLWGFIRQVLERAGVTVSVTGNCTYAEEENFFSYRRTTHRQEPDYGRQLSAISIRRM